MSRPELDGPAKKVLRRIIKAHGFIHTLESILKMSEKHGIAGVELANKLGSKLDNLSYGEPLDCNEEEG